MTPNTYVEAAQAWLGTLAEDWSVKLAAGSAITFLASWFGDDWWLVSVLLGLIFADLVLGLASAWHFNGGLSGKRLHQGVVKFIAYALAIVLVWLVQQITLHSLPVSLPVLALFSAYQSLTEISSIVRHLERLGLRMPPLLTRITDAGTHHVDERIDSVLSKKQQDKEST